MYKIIKRILLAATSIISLIFIFFPDELILKVKLFSDVEDYVNLMVNKIIIFLVLIIILVVTFVIFEKVKFYHIEKDKNHNIEIRYDDVLHTKKGLHLINFDECFTTKVGTKSGDIKKGSLCGQYLTTNPITDMDKLLIEAKIKPERRKSKYLNKECYKPGTIIRRDNDLLMAFAKLDVNGLAEFNSLSEYMECLTTMWHQIYINHGESSVCIPILGSGRTKIGDKELSQQELLDIMIFSYKTSYYRLKKPNKLYICCRRSNDFSLNKIGKAL